MVTLRPESRNDFIDIIGQNKNGTGSYNFNSTNYKAGICGSGYTLTGDIPQGNPTYDAARANMGEPWKMFTKEQGQELIDNTTSEWTTINGIKGIKFTPKIDISTYIFIPAAGRWNTDFNEVIGYSGHSWSTTYRDSSDAWYLSFSSNHLLITSAGRTGGWSIRPIRTW